MDMIKATISALEEDMPAAAVKLGMMGTDAVVCAVGDFLDGYEGKVVCDPVMISTRWAAQAFTRCLLNILARYNIAVSSGSMYDMCIQRTS